MPRDLLQQEKLLRLQRFLLEETDEDHSVTIAEMQAYLATFGIHAERKSLYENIETLIHCGMDIGMDRAGGKNHYRLLSREFETAELRLLADAVASSRFITTRKSADLLRKLSRLASRHQGGGLQRHVFVPSRIKNMNETIFYLIDDLNRALTNGVTVEFSYFHWVSEQGKLVKQARHEAKRYLVSPWQLLWQDEFYYLVAFDHEYQQIRHYRVDRMGNLRLTKEPRQGEEAFRSLQPEGYTSRVFGMFGGKAETVTLRFPPRLLDTMIDRFGKELRLTEAQGMLEISTEVVPSRPFYGWLFSLGSEVTLVGPVHLKEEYGAALRQDLEKEQQHG